MKRYWVKLNFKDEPVVESANVLRETKQYYFLDDYGPRYSKRVDKHEGLSITYESARDAVKAFITSAEQSVDSIRDTLDKKIFLLRKYTEWARQNTAEAGNSAPNT